jgi:hypothetical protein
MLNKFKNYILIIVEDVFVRESDIVKRDQVVAKLTSKEFLSKYKSYIV